MRTIMDDDVGGPQSLFVVVSYESQAPCVSSILRLQLDDTPKQEKRIPNQEKRILVTEKDYVANFITLEGFSSCFSWSFSPPTRSTGYNMYMVPEHRCSRAYHEFGEPLHGTKFNFSTGACVQIKPPTAPKYYGNVVNWEGLSFFMTHPDWYYDAPDPVFEFYDPDENKWNPLQPFPNFHDGYPLWLSVVATAVLDDTILYNIGHCQFWAYNVAKDKWYIVHVEDNLCYSIFGEAVVLENTIYALTNGCPSTGLVLALSIERKEINDDDLVYNCSLQSQISVPGFQEIKYDFRDANANRKLLFHLGGDNFCVVQSCTFYTPSDRYPIHLTRIKLSGKNSMIVTDMILYEVEVLRQQQFQVRLCFTLPDCKTTPLEGKVFTISLDPESEQFQAPTHGDGADKEGCSIYLTNVPPDASFGEIEEKLKKFGPIKRFGIQVSKNKEGNCCFASVEFQRATSKRCAIKASPIVIGGWQVEVNEKKTSLIDISNRTSSSSPSVENKFKNHGDDSRPKTTLKPRLIDISNRTSSSSTSVENKFKNHGDDSPFKTTLKTAFNDVRNRTSSSSPSVTNKLKKHSDYSLSKKNLRAK